MDHGSVLHEGFTDPIQELLGAYQPTNFKLERVNASTIKVAAGTENSQVSIAINGRYRWRTTETTAALPGGLKDGEHPVFVTASDNDFSGPIKDIDAPTVYTFGLEIKEAGKTPTTALYREVGKVTVAANAITAIRQTVGSIDGAQIENGALSGEGDITWTRDVSGAWVPQIKGGAIGTAEIADGAVSSRKVKLTEGEVSATEDLELTEAYADIPGATLEITPPVASILKVYARYCFEFKLPAETLGLVMGSVRVGEGSESKGAAVYGRGSSADITDVAMRRQTTITQTFRLKLAAEKAQVVKLRARRSNNSFSSAKVRATITAAGGNLTGFIYELVSQ
jgi:hypothetical protein